MTYAQRAEVDRNRVAPNLQGASATKLERRLLASGGSTLGVLALLAGVGVWRSHSDSADQKPINVAGALPGLSGKPVPLAGVPAAEEAAFRVARLVLGLRMISGDFGMGLREPPPYIFDRPCLADAAWALDERVRGAVAKAALERRRGALPGADLRW